MIPAAALHVETFGAGPNLALLHGWAMHGGIWRDVADRLAAYYRVHVVDLPGHGRSAMPDTLYTLDVLADVVASALPAPLTLAGWSLGGLVALTFALRRPDHVTGLVLTGATPQFTAGAGWAHGLDAAVLDGFGARLRDDPEQTVRRFLALQVRGSDDERRTLARLKAALDGAPAPDPRALDGGLTILRETSLLPALADIRQPALVIHGTRDALAPAAAAEELARRLPRATLHAIDGAGHAPFLSHLDRFTALIATQTDAGRL
jgi:pimeloyl-[acyl-carrier protein] methyl ester esterase